MKKILVVLTGGTIGSRIEGTTIDITDVSSYHLISLYRERYGDRHEFEVINPISVLSENMRPQIWTELVHALWNVKWEDYSGAIITHGSDTLAYTSAFLGMLFSYASVPIVLTASNYPLGTKGSNGLVNFRSCVELIETPGLRGVFTVYQNDKQENCVYLATRITEADCYRDQFGAFGGKVFGKLKEGRLCVEECYTNPTVQELAAFCEKKQKPIGEAPVFHKKVLMIRPYPGMDYRYIDLMNRPAAVLHYLYHSATACTEGEGYSLTDFLKRCKEENIPVYTASYKSEDGPAYITAKEILGAGAEPMRNISPEAAYMKLVLWYNMEEKFRESMEESLYFEHLPAHVDRKTKKKF